MAKNTKYFSVSRAQWHHIGFSTVFEMRAQQANENNLFADKKKHRKIDNALAVAEETSSVQD